MTEEQRSCVDCAAVLRGWTEWQAANVLAVAEGREPIPCPDEAPSATRRKAPHGGPRSARCTTHYRKRKAAERAAKHEAYVARTYSLSEREYGKLYEAQGGVCAICERATGATRRLSVDHDHACCNGGVSCGYCVRGLLCRPCNDMLGHLRDDWQAFARAVRYLTQKPAAERVLGKRRTAERQERMP